MAPSNSEAYQEINEHELQKGKDDAIEVSYSVVLIDQNNIDDVLQRIATIINVQLESEAGERLPFVPFTKFDSVKNADKIFLFGPSGVGKSRSIFEVVTQSLGSSKKIYFINPRNPVGIETGRIKLLDLINKFKQDEGVVWDNFPDDLVKRDPESALRVLELLASKGVKSLIISLKPKYLEIYRDLLDKIPEFTACEVSYDKEAIRNIIISYGSHIRQFKELFQRYVVEHTDKISRILWQKEPTPLTILGYYRWLRSRMHEQSASSRSIIDPVGEAEKLLRRTEYYEQQFEQMSRMQGRKSDSDFLYTLKLCYEGGLDRRVGSVEKLQLDVFGTQSQPNVLGRLGTWIYASGTYYAMHDAQRESIKFTDDVKLRIMEHLTRNFVSIIPTEDSQLNAFGLFLGRNIHFAPKEALLHFLGPEIHEHMKRNRYFQTALGLGVGENFLTLDEQLQEEMMKRMSIDIEFARGAVLGIGERFPILDRIRQREILEEKSKRFACVPLFAESLGINFKAMTDDLRNELFETAERNPQFADGFGRGLGSNIKFFEPRVQEEIFRRATKNSEFTRGFGYSHAFHVIAADKSEQQSIFDIADKNSHFSMGLGMGFAYLFGDLSEEHLQQVFDRAATDDEFAFGLGLYLGFNFHPLSRELQNWQLDTVEQNGRFAYGLGYGYGITFPYYPQEIQSSLFERAERNADFAFGLGSGLGYSFGSLNDKLREAIFVKISGNTEFAFGLGAGLAFVSLLLPPKVWTDVFELTEKNPRFAKGIGYGFGWIFRFLPTPVRNDLLEKSERNSQLAVGLGYGLGLVFPYVPEVLQSEVITRASVTPNLAYGLGIGIGILLRYHENELRGGILDQLKLDVHFAKGLGEGTGYIFKYLPNEKKQTILDRLKKDTYFSYGFGAGIGQKIEYLSVELKNEILEKIDANPHLAEGLAYGIGAVYQFIPADVKDKIFGMADRKMRIARGLGQGLGSVIQYASESMREETIFGEMRKDPLFARGASQGIGEMLQYLSEDLKKRIIQEADKSAQVAIGLGTGMASTFCYLYENHQQEILSLSEQNRSLSQGLGSGFGLMFPSLSDKLRQMVKSKAATDYYFAKGLGRGIGLILPNISGGIQGNIVEIAREKQSFAIGVGYGMAEALTIPKSLEFPHAANFDAVLQIPMVCDGFGFALAHAFPDLKDEQQVMILEQLLTYKPRLASSIGRGLGHVFPLLATDQQERLVKLAQAHDREFGKGLGEGIGYGFKNLDELVQDGLFALCSGNNDSLFASGLGMGIGKTFPSLSEGTRKMALERLPQENCGLTESFSLGLSQSFKYLDNEIRELILISPNDSLKGILSEALDSSQTASPLVEEYYEDFPLPKYIAARKMYEAQSWEAGKNEDLEVTFTGIRQNCCICYIDMMDSTNIASRLKENELGKYYSIFLNSTAMIARNFGAKIIKNAGDCLIYYFPKTSNNVDKPHALKDVIECGITMMSAHGAINAKLHEEKLPPLNYRISADYGMVELAKSKSSQSEDLFGSAMNLCAKINSKAPQNGMVIGESLYKLVRPLEGYSFMKVQDHPNSKNQFPAYRLETLDKRTILNPFKRSSGS